MEHYKNLSLINISDDEIWKEVVGYEGIYEVSNHGRVKSLPRKFVLNPKILKQKIGTKKNGQYCQISISKNGNTKHTTVHILVAKAFIPNPESKPTVNHIDAIKHNNHISNLEWNTYSENEKHAFKIGVKKPNIDNPKIQGSKNINSKLTEKDVLEIRRLRKEGVKCVDISKIYNINAQNVSNITLRQSWKHI